MRTIAVALAAAAIVCCVTGVACSQPMLWPIPLSVTKLSTVTRPIDLSGFNISNDDPNANIVDAIQRYTDIIFATAGRGESALYPSSVVPLKSLWVNIVGHDNRLGPDTDYSYMIDMKVDNPIAMIQANNVFGAMAGLETFSQLIQANATIAVSSIHIEDSPMYKHRGLMIDSGRRFAPVQMLRSMIDAMGYSKMNVLHLHLSDWGGFRYWGGDADLQPLVKDLGTQYYSKQDVADLLGWATHRGVRIVAEVDVPSHSGCFAPLIPHGLKFCDPRNELLAADSVTLGWVKKAIASVMEVFPDVVFHMGGDETIPQGDCTWDTIHTFEREIQEFIKSKGRTPMAWNEVFSKPNVTTEPNAALNGTIIQNWEASPNTDTTGHGFESVASPYSSMYLDQQCCAAGRAAMTTGNRMKQCYYHDISVPGAADSLMAGGEAAMWTDLYCPGDKCPNEGQFAWMYPSSADPQFSASLLAMVWPRASAAAGGLWNYNKSLDLDGDYYADLIDAHNARLQARGVKSCPNGCTCDWGHQCGNPYGEVPPYPMQIELTNKCKFHINVKQVTPCESGAGVKLAVIEPGDSFNVTTDFIVEGGSPLAIGDPWGEWVGSGGWRDLRAKLDVSWSKSDPSYITYTQTYPVPP